jgi:hypothetical protein
MRICQQVVERRRALADEDCWVEAVQILRTLIERIELAPVEQGKGLSVGPHGQLAFSGWPPKPKGRSRRASLRSSAQDWLRGLASDVVSRSCQYASFSGLCPSCSDSPYGGAPAADGCGGRQYATAKVWLWHRRFASSSALSRRVSDPSKPP